MSRYIAQVATVKDAIALPRYRKLLAAVVRDTGAQVSSEPVPGQVLSYVLEDHAAGGVSLAETMETLGNSEDRATRFCVLKVKEFGVYLETQEYPKGEEPGAEDLDDMELIHPYYEDFLLRHLLEYHLLTCDSNALEVFLKETRTPQLRAYRNILKRLYGASATEC